MNIVNLRFCEECGKSAIAMDDGRLEKNEEGVRGEERRGSNLV